MKTASREIIWMSQKNLKLSKLNNDELKTVNNENRTVKPSCFTIKSCPGYLFTASANTLPALKRATFLAAIFIAAPVCGFLPTLAFLFEIENVPNPTSETLAPFFRALVTLVITESKAVRAATFVMLASEAIGRASCRER